MYGIFTVFFLYFSTDFPKIQNFNSKSYPYQSLLDNIIEL